MSRINILKHDFTGTGNDNTPEGALIRTGGKHVEKTITLSANNTTATVNVFQFTGAVKCFSLHAEVADATTLTNCTDIYFDIWDGTNSVVLSKITSANISGFGVGSFIIKTDAAASALTTLQNDQVRLQEVTGKLVAQEFHIQQKIATNSYIRFTYTTTDAPINAQLDIHLEWADIDSGTVTAV